MRQEMLQNLLFQIQCYQTEEGDFSSHVENVLDHADLDEGGIEDLIGFLDKKLDNTLPIGVASYWTTLKQGVEDWKHKHYGETYE